MTNVSASLSSSVLVEQLEVVVTDLVAGRGAISRSGHTDEWAAAMRAVRSRHRQVRQAWHALTCTNTTCLGPADQGSSNGCQGALNVTNSAGESARDSTLRTLRERTNAPTAIPRYARVNVARATRDHVRQHLLEDQDPALKGVAVEDDALLPDGLVFPAGTDLHAHALVQSGVLVLQDRASCMAAHVLCATGHGTAPQLFSVIADACAAPGNKASHLAAIALVPGGTVLAVEAGRNFQRSAL